MTDVSAFETFVGDAEPRLRRTLVARFGVEVGNDLTADVIAYAWEHWEAIASMANPVGYLYRVGQSSARRYRRWGRRPSLPVEESFSPADPEPALGAALARLRPDQRTAVLLVHAYGWSYAEAAEVLDIPITTLRNHLHRGLARLRQNLEP